MWDRKIIRGYFGSQLCDGFALPASTHRKQWPKEDPGGIQRKMSEVLNPNLELDWTWSFVLNTHSVHDGSACLTASCMSLPHIYYIPTTTAFNDSLTPTKVSSAPLFSFAPTFLLPWKARPLRPQGLSSDFSVSASKFSAETTLLWPFG